MHKSYWLLIFLLISGCATIGLIELDNLYGQSNIENRLSQPQASPEQAHTFTHAVQPIIENRCVVCHGCYDAPCQLKMESRAGIERGASKALVYNGERLLTAKISDSLDKLNDLTSDNLAPLRRQGFFPILNERQQTEQANAQSSLFYKMLALKQQHPLPNDNLLNDDFDVSLSRKQQCPTIEQFDQYQKSNPLGGMPYGLPALSTNEHNQLTRWLVNGAIMPSAEPPTAKELQLMARWETLLNGTSAKEQLISRYLFEHLYLANLYFDSTQSSYFKLVRSSTPPGEKVAIIHTRRPFDSPYADEETKTIVGAPNVFYRLIKHNDTIITKRHMPYPFGDAKLSRIKALFYQPHYSVTDLPDYKLANASNPFKTFKDIPGKARYQFLLDQAQFSIMNFIKGSVCRGQTALNVIEDNFWVFFINPDNFDRYPSDDFINANSDLLQLPAATSDKTISLIYWQRYAKRQQKYLKKKLSYVEKLNLADNKLNLDLIWSGDGNPNATLTVFRHFDSASVLKGFVGPTPKTAWLISYPLLERIHYLLVAGFDVYGNVAHQLKTRLYMDFLRMEAESNFISFLPKAQRKPIHEHWYRDTSDDIKDYIFSDNFYQLPETGIKYQTMHPKEEFLKQISEYTHNANVSAFNIPKSSTNTTEQIMGGLTAIPAEHINLLAQVSYVMVTSGSKNDFFTIINNTAHRNVAHLFSENDRLIPKEDNIVVLRGIIGNYPNAFFKVDSSQLSDFSNMLTTITDEAGYSALKDKFAIRRTNPNFWQYADELHAWYKENQPESAGLLDFNRLENR